jgi:hypothetical protein
MVIKYSVPLSVTQVRGKGELHRGGYFLTNQFADDLGGGLMGSFGFQYILFADPTLESRRNKLKSKVHIVIIAPIPAAEKMAGAIYWKGDCRHNIKNIPILKELA